MDTWAIIGRLAVIVTIFTALFRFISWWRAPKEKLIAKVLPSPFTLPPTVENELSEKMDKIQGGIDVFLQRYPKKEDGYDEAYDRAKMLSSDVHYSLNRSLSYETLRLTGCWRARVDNNGKKKCLGVNLHLPHSVLASVQHDSDREATVRPVNGIVGVGEIRPHGHCVVVAWTNFPVVNRDNYDVVLTHDSGVGRVLGQWQTTRLGWIVGTFVERENIVSLLVPLIFAILGIIISLSGLSFLSKVMSKPAATASHSWSTPKPTPTPIPPR